MDPLYLVDGSGYIFRAYYAVQPLSTSKGLPSNALIGFSRMLIKLLRDVEARYIAVAFDTGEKTFRHELYSEYKANRAECPEDLVPQMPYFRKIVEAFGLRSFEKVGVEADDVIATITRKLSPLGHPIVIVSGDKDLTQLVDDQVQVWDAMRDVVFDQEKVKEKFGVSPQQMLDYLALTGDSSDNIPGVKGIGPKTAVRLLEHFGSIERILENCEEIGGLNGLRGAKTVQGKIESGGEMLRLSRELVRLDCEVEPFNKIAAMEELSWSEVNQQLLVPLLEELEFSSLSDAFDLSMPGEAAGQTEENRYQGKRYKVVDSEHLPEFVSALSAEPRFAFDTETSSLDIKTCQLVGISFSWEPEVAYYLPLGGEAEPERQLDPNHVRELLGPIFANPEIKKVGLNLKFDIEVLEEQGYAVNGVAFDGMLCSYVINPDKRAHGLKALASIHLGEEMKTFKEIVDGKDNIGQVEIDRVAQYACHDAEISWVLQEKLDNLLGEHSDDKEPSLRSVFEEIEMPLVSVLAAIERKGVYVDAALLSRLGEEFSSEAEKLKESVWSLAGVEFNLNSPKQVGNILFEHLAIPTKGIKKTKSGYSTDASVLSKLAADHQIAAQLLEHRELQKLISTYTEALLRLIHPITGRIHASFNQAVAATGRLSSSDPNLQNIPIRNPRGRRIRQAFIAEAGNVLISADYSQIELRILAHLSGDSTLQEAFLVGEDIHLRTAKEIFGNALLDSAEMKELRRVAKTINFGIIYGMSAFRLAGELGVSRKQAAQYIDDYFARYPRVLEFFEQLKNEMETKGYVTTLFGRRRYVEDLDTSGRDAGYAGRSMINAPIQGSAAEVIKISMINLHRRLATFGGSANIVLQVHDELVVEAEQSCVDEVKEIVVCEMEGAVQLAIPLKVDMRVSETWGEVV